ncbi:uncharacterized protein LOC132066676 [Lycium ferocissimum]|uniref:uncharacterized protein LOC132066676 n=1 Tax=Lycium ferocissimum TaxID=112874 RepID=UPI002816115A|nr:uncharacterized protein LOC132066676 [Lycium ferocissimum]
MGFKSLQDVSKALFSKLWWNFRTKQSLWRMYMSNKYLKKEHAVTVQWKRGTYIWRKLIQCRDIVEKEIWWQVKQGLHLQEKTRTQDFSIIQIACTIIQVGYKRVICTWTSSIKVIRCVVLASYDAQPIESLILSYQMQKYSEKRLKPVKQQQL